MNWRAWDDIETILCDQRIKPILAVVPDNRDDTLRVSAPNARFWDRVREWQAWGWTIAMHGWQHRFVTNYAGILGVNKRSEFAGLPRYEQRSKLWSGLEVFRREGIDSTVWIAPAHSFDTVTIEVLIQLGFRYISDGFFPLPHVDEFGLTWIPQQLWSFRWRPFGVWTICFHMNHWTSADILSFKKSTARLGEAISSFTVIADQYDGRQKTLMDSVAARLYRSAAEVKPAINRLFPPSYRSTVIGKGAPAE